MRLLTKALSKNILTIGWDRSVESAHLLMKQRKIRHLGVTDEFGKVYGILSDRDVRRAMRPNRPGFPDGTVVCNFTSSPPITVDESVDVAEVADLMVRKKISCVLVTSGPTHIVGIVTTEDLLKLLGRTMRSAPKAKRSKIAPLLPLVGELLKELGSAGI